MIGCSVGNNELTSENLQCIEFKVKCFIEKLKICINA